VLLLAAAAVRIPLVGSPPLLSDDLFRYLWEGTVLAAGGNPFLESPASLPGLDDALRAHVNHPGLTSIYPPLALGWFRLLHLLGGSPWLAQACTASLDLVTVLALALMLRGTGGSVWPAWLYALHPVPALESAAGAHLDVVAVALTAAAVLAWQRGRPGPAVLGVVAGAGVKLFPVLLLPVMFTRQAWRREVAGLLIAGVAMVVLLWPVLDAGPALVASMHTYWSSWSFNGLVYPLLAPVLGPYTRPVLAGAGVTAVGWGWWRYREPVGTWAVAGAAFVLLSPTVHPWYLLWVLVPSLMRRRWGWAAASVALLGSYGVLLGYDPGTDQWQVPAWLPWITWGPALAFLAVEALLRRHVKQPTAPSGPPAAPANVRHR